jgi:hypothetical protein
MFFVVSVFSGVFRRKLHTPLSVDVKMGNLGKDAIVAAENAVAVTTYKGFRLGAAEQAILAVARRQIDGPSDAAALRHVLASWARREMEKAGVAVDLFGTGDDVQALDLYMQYSLAVQGIGDMRLARIPAGGFWEREGFAGRLYPMHATCRLTTDGLEYWTSDRPLPENWLSAESAV